MKFYLFLISVLFSGFSFGQELLCDSIYLKSGEGIAVKVISKQRKTITYCSCMNGESGSKKLRRKYIDKIVYAQQEGLTNFINRRDSLPYLEISKLNSAGRKVKRISENTKLIVNTKDSLTFRGKLLVLSKDSILLKSKRDSVIPIAITNVLIIKKPSKASKIIGNTIGGLFAYLGFALLIDLGLEEGAPFAVIADGISLPFFAMNYIRKRYNLETKWKAEVKFQKIE